MKSVTVEGSVAGEDGAAHTFKFENMGYFLDGAAVSSRKAIQTSLGGSATFSDCTITITCAHRPWGYGGGGGGGSGGGGGGGDAHVEEKEEEEEEEEEEVDMGGGMDMFGGDEGGGDDY